MIKTFLFSSLLVLSSCASKKVYAESIYAKDPIELDRFDFPAPGTSDLGQRLSLWATYYLTPKHNESTGDYPLRNKNGELLGPMLTKKEWCNVALEGSVQIVSKNSEIRTYNYAGVTPDHAVNCKEFFKFDVSKTKFTLAHGPFGDGLPDRYILAPFRTLATDNSYIVPGSVLFIPKARGAKIILPNGKSIIHDGYFFAGDKGGAIKGNHVDVFIGTDKNAPYFPWIRSNQSMTFDAFIIKDQKIISELTDLHAQ